MRFTMRVHRSLHNYFTGLTEVPYDKRPSAIATLTRMLITGLNRKQGVFNTADGKLPVGYEDKLVVRATDCRIKNSHLTRYAKLASMPLDKKENILPIYLESLFMPIIFPMTCWKDFLLSPFGLIHTGQVIRQREDLTGLLDQPCELECRVEEHRVGPKGIEMTVVLRVYDSRGRLVWDGFSTLLSRSPSISKAGDHSAVEKKKASFEETKIVEKVKVDIPVNVCVEYAKLSGDWTPHHVPYVALLMGFKKPIAHGLWTVARATSLIHMHDLFSLKPPFTMAVQFKRPVFLPGTSEFGFMADSKSHLDFTVKDFKSKAPQVIGSVKRGLQPFS